jgi:serine/threonine protein kinase
MATGKPPWSEYNNVIAIMLRIAKADRPPEFPSHLSSKAKSFLDACLRIKPEERWTVNKLLKHPFV